MHTCVCRHVLFPVSLYSLTSKHALSVLCSPFPLLTYAYMCPCNDVYSHMHIDLTGLTDLTDLTELTDLTGLADLTDLTDLADLIGWTDLLD